MIEIDDCAAPDLDEYYNDMIAAILTLEDHLAAHGLAGPEDD